MLSTILQGFAWTQKLLNMLTQLATPNQAMQVQYRWFHVNQPWVALYSPYVISMTKDVTIVPKPKI